MQKKLEKFIFSSKWILIPFYLGLFVAMFVYMYVYMRELWVFMSEVRHLTINMALLSILELVDIIMIANLLKMIITGSYASFVNKDHDEPTEKSSSGILKVKLATSLIGVSSIQLLQTFINVNPTNAATVDWDRVYKQLAIHGMFLLGALVLSVIDYLHEKTETFVHYSNSTTKHD